MEIQQQIIHHSKASDNFLNSILALFDDLKTLETDKQILTIAWFRIACDAHQAINLLIRNGLHFAAASQLRLTFEVTVRALWTNQCATDADLERIKEDNFDFPRMAEMVAQVDSRLQTYGFFQRVKEVSWRKLNSFAHGGFEQIARCFDGDKITSSYSDVELKRLIDYSNSMLQLLSVAVARTFGLHDKAEQIQALVGPN